MLLLPPPPCSSLLLFLLPAPFPPPCSHSVQVLSLHTPVRVPREILNYFILFSLIVCIDDDDADVRRGDSSDDEDVWEVPVVLLSASVYALCAAGVFPMSRCVSHVQSGPASLDVHKH